LWFFFVAWHLLSLERVARVKGGAEGALGSLEELRAELKGVLSSLKH